MKQPKIIENFIFTIMSLTFSRRCLFAGITIGIFIVSLPLSFYFGIWWLLPDLLVLIFWHVLSSWYCKTIKKIEKEQEDILKQTEKKADSDEITLIMSQKEYETLRKEGNVVLEDKYPITLDKVNFVRGNKL
jgi:hypothetical protein